MPRLWVMRSPDNVALEFLAQDLRIAALNATGHGLAHVGERMMSIKPAQLDDLAIEFKTMIGELRLSKADPARIFIEQVFASQQPYVHGVQTWIREIPQLDRAVRAALFACLR